MVSAPADPMTEKGAFPGTKEQSAWRTDVLCRYSPVLAGHEQPAGRTWRTSSLQTVSVLPETFHDPPQLSHLQGGLHGIH